MYLTHSHSTEQADIGRGLPRLVHETDTILDAALLVLKPEQEKEVKDRHDAELETAG